MKVNELRIGNYIRQVKTHNGFDWDKIRTIAAINKEGYLSVNVLEVGEIGLTLSKLKIDKFVPIHLTEEWLVRLGFKLIGERNEVVNDYESNEAIFRKGEGGQCMVKFVKEWYGSTEDKPERYIQFYWYDDSLISIQHVHQLQNLYFALTGEELTIKPI